MKSKIFVYVLLIVIPALSAGLFAQSYKEFEYGKTSRECGYPGYTFDVNVIIETSKKYPNPTIILVTPEERRKVEEEIRLWNIQKEQPRRGMDPCSTCSQEYEACVVYEIYEGKVTKDCANWKEWRDDWDEKVRKVIDDALGKYARLDLNSYTLNFKLQVDPDGRVIRWEMGKPPGTTHPPDSYSRTPPYTRQELQELGEIGAKIWSDMAEWSLEQLSKIQACPFPKGSRFKIIERTPSIYHNVKGKEGKTPSPIPQEPQ